MLTSLRQATRSLLRTPGFTAAALVTLALGIAGTSALFSVVYGVLLRPLPYPEEDRMVELRQVDADGAAGNLSEPNFLDLRERSRSFSAMAMISMQATVSVLGSLEPTRATMVQVSDGYFEVLGVAPAVGRSFVAEERVPGGRPAVVVSHAFWERHLGSRPDPFSVSLSFGGGSYAVVGVMPAELDALTQADLLVAREIAGETQRRTAHNWRAMGRLADGVTLEAARGELSAIAREVRAAHGDDTWMRDVAVTPVRERIIGSVRPALLILLGAAALLFLIAVANVGNLLLTRAAGRRREFAVRLALGAGRARLVRSAIVEAMLLAVTAALIGVLLATWGVELLRTIAPANLPRSADIRIDAVVLAVTLGAAIATALLLGLAIGTRGVAGGLRQALSERRSGGGGSTGRVRALLVTSQVALTVILLVGAALLGRSFHTLLAVEPGFRTSGAAVLSLNLDWPQDEGEAARQDLFRAGLIARLAAIPGVGEVGGINGLPFQGGYSSGSFLLLERADEVSGFDDFETLARDPSRVGSAEYRIATDRYFAAMGIPVLRGRAFDERDRVDAPHVAVVSESLARATWPGIDPIGRLVQFGNMDGDLRAFTVVGVVGDVREGGFDGEVHPTFYANARQRIPPASQMEVVIHTPGSVRGVLHGVRATFREMAPELPVRLRTLDEISAGAVAQRRFSLILFAVFGGAALLLAAVGLYGVVSYAVTQRTHEIGVRAALGAQSGDVTAMVVRQGALLAGAGLVAGLIAAVFLTRLLAGLLYGVRGTDPVAYGAVSLLLTAVALLASYLPARRAARTDPMIALRAE
jgi:putative ABC transport system permease protein